MDRIEHRLGSIAALAHAKPWWSLAFAALVTLVGGYLARNLSLNPDLVDLLPKSFESVQDIDKLRDRFGGIGYVVVVGMGADQAGLERFADDMAPQLEALSEIRFVEYKRSWQFFEDHALYYLDRQDLEEIEKRIEARIDYERQARNPMFVMLDDEPPPSLDFSDIEDRYTGRMSRRMVGNSQDYYINPKEQIIALLAKPASSATNLGYAKSLYEQVEGLVAKLDLKKYGPDFHVSYTGTYRKKLDQQVQLSRDLAFASTVAMVLLVLYLLFHFRSVLAVVMVLTPVTVGLIWTYGFVGVVYSQVNILTGFLGAILGGLGTEHGIHLLGRYEALRSGGEDSQTATRGAFSHTGASALISASVAALTFASLRISEFRAFREFGVIAAIGMLATLLAYFPTVPAILGIATRFGWKPKASRTVTGEGSELAAILPRIHRPVALGLGVITIALTLNIGNARFDYDFAALEDASLESYQLDRKTNRILGYSQTPVVVLTEKVEDERAVTDELNRRIASMNGNSTIDFVASLDDLVPDAQAEKQVVLGRMASALGRIPTGNLDTTVKDAIARAKRMTAATPFTVQDVPANVRRQFQGVGKTDTSFVLVFPAISLSDGEKVLAFAKEVRKLQLPDGSTTAAAGDAMVLADIIEMVRREAMPILVATLTSVLVAMWLTLGRLRTALVCMFPTVASVLALVGLMPIVEMRFNYLNIVIIPVLIGTTVDAGVHLVSRFKESGGKFASIYGETGRAITGGLLTSAVGFGAMLLADHPGLNSLGGLTILGFAVNLTGMLLGFPALLLMVEARREKRATNRAVGG